MSDSNVKWIDGLQFSSLYWPLPQDVEQKKAQILAYVEYFGNSEQFPEDIAQLIQSSYPSKESRLVDEVLATFVLHHPEHGHAVVHPIISRIIDGTLCYDRHGPPFSSFISLFSHTSEQEYSEQWALACGEILRVLTHYNRPIFKVERQHSEAECSSTSDQATSSDSTDKKSNNSPGNESDWKPLRPLTLWITDILLAAPLGMRSDYFRWCGGVMGKYAAGGELKPPTTDCSRGSGKHPQLMPSRPRWTVANGAGVILSVCDEEVARYETANLTAAAVPALLLPPPTTPLDEHLVAGLPPLEPYIRLFHRYYAIAKPSATQRLVFGLLEAPPSWAPDALDAVVQLVELLREAEDHASGMRLPKNWMHLHFLRAIGTAMSMRAGIAVDTAAALVFRILSQPTLLFPPLRHAEGVEVHHEPLGGYVSSYKEQDIPIIDWIDTAMEGLDTASLGPMAPLLQKIFSLEFMAPRDIQVSPSDDDIKHFKKHLEVLCRDLLEPEETSSMPRWWRKEVRELLYDTEDRLDVILLLGGDFSELIAVVEDACKRRKRLKLAPNDKTIKPDPGEVCVSCLPPESTSHEMSMPISSGSCLVGFDELMNKLVKQLAFDDHNQKQLKVVPILGFPGVGKTTASGTLYHEHRGKFQCSAFVRVSQTPDMRNLLFSILLQIKAPRFWAFPDVHCLTDGIKKHLKGKKYFIILDGLRTASVWDIMSRAFPDGNYGSRIVTTTQINDVALACCRYYPDYIEMSPLNDDQSQRLFFTIVFGSEDCCPSDFKQVSYKIIKKCAGLPLAIVNVASLLGRGSKLSVEKWEHIQDSLPSILRTNDTTNEGMNDFSSDTVIGSEGSQLARGTEIQKWKHTQDYCSTFEGLKQVLMYIYNNFPPHLKTCLLYLSMYPEGYLVRKHDLVRQWVAEGFMIAVGGRSTEQIAGYYFDELVHSGIVQPVDTKYGSKVLSCTVHHMVLDIIRHKSKEMNFIITVDHLQSWLALPDQVRRLSIQFGGAKSADIPENIMISKIRSLLFCGFIDCVPTVVDYVFLRVLILDIWADGDETEFDLTRISELLRLRYLKIQCNVMVNLPDEIRGLKYLETLEVDARLSAVPSDIGRLEKLLHLLLPSEAILPQGYGSLTSLLTLGCFDLSKNSLGKLMNLVKLTNLHDLRFTCSTIRAELLLDSMKLLGLILGKFNNLRSLALHGAAGTSSQSICDDGLSSVSPSPALLEKLELRPRICTLSRLPKWIGELSRLAILKIEVLDLSNDDIAILEGLTSLTALSLCVPAEHVERIVFKKGFPALKYFKFVRTAPYISLLEGAMPNVQKLKLAFNANRLKPGYSSPRSFGFKHMTSLTEVTVKFGGANADESSKGDAECVLRDAFGNNPSSPIVNIQWVDCIFSGSKINDGKDTKTQDASR